MPCGVDVRHLVKNEFVKKRPESGGIGCCLRPTPTLRPHCPIYSSSDSTAIGGMTRRGRPTSSIFRDVAHARRGGWSTDLARYHLRERVSRADEKLIERIAEAQAPFWQHVRDAIAARHP